MDLQFIIIVVCASGLVELCYSDSYPNLENAQRFEICVIGRMSRSMLFSIQEKSQMSKIFKETGVRMHSMDVDPSNAANARTMLRLFTAALTNLVFDAENPLKKSERKQHFLSTLELCSKSLPNTTASELISEVSRILSTMENKKSDIISRKVENLLDKPVDPSASEYKKSKSRQKRSYIPPQSSGSFQSNAPLDSVLAGVLLTAPSFGSTFKSGVTKQEATYYSRAMVEAGLKAAGYDYTVINDALNEVTKAISNLGFMPQTYDYAFAISSSINTALDAQGIANFADGIFIGNTLISNLKIISEIPSPVFSVPPSSGAVSSSSVWDSGTDDTRQPPLGAPFQLNPSWDTPVVPTFQVDSFQKDFAPNIFTGSDSQFPLNPSFSTNPAAPQPALDFGSSADFPSFSANIPYQQETFPASKDYPIYPDSVPFPADQFSQQNPMIYNQPAGASTDKSIPFSFDNMGSQEFPFTSFEEPAPAQQPWLLNQESSQAVPINPQTFDSFDYSIPETPVKETSTFILPTDSIDNTNPTNFKDAPLTFDQYPYLTEIPGQTSVPSMAQSETFLTEESDGKSNPALPLNAEPVQPFTGPSIPFGSNTEESSLTLLSDTLVQQEPTYNQPNTNTDASSNNSSIEVPKQDFSNSGGSTEIKDLPSDEDLTFPPASDPFVSSSTTGQSSNSDSTTTAWSATYPLDVTESSTQAMDLSSIVDNLYTTTVTIPATPTKDPYVRTLSDAVKTPDKLFEILMGEVNSSLKSLNQTPVQKTTNIDELIPVTTTVLTAVMDVDSTNSQQPLTSTLPELLPTPLPSQNVSPESEPATEKDQFDDQASIFAQRVSSIATSTIAYIRSGNVNLDELCGKLNVLAFMVDIPPVDDCTEIPMIDFQLNVLNAVISTLRSNR